MEIQYIRQRKSLYNSNELETQYLVRLPSILHHKLNSLCCNFFKLSSGTGLQASWRIWSNTASVILRSILCFSTYSVLLLRWCYVWDHIHDEKWHSNQDTLQIVFDDGSKSDSTFLHSWGHQFWQDPQHHWLKSHLNHDRASTVFYRRL